MGTINDKKIIYIVIAIACGVAYYMLGGGDNGTGVGEIRTDIQSIREESDRARAAVGESKYIVEEIGRTNNELKQTYSDIKREIDNSGTINQSDAELIREGQSLTQHIKERNKR